MLVLFAQGESLVGIVLRVKVWVRELSVWEGVVIEVDHCVVVS